MNRFATFFSSALILFACAEFTLALTTPANQPPVITHPIPNYDQYLETTRVLDLSQFFSDPDATAAARMTTSLGPITITLDGQHAPATVANFLNYVNSGRYFIKDPTDGDRASTFFHRSVSNFVIQGGGFLGTVNPNGSGNLLVTEVTTFPAVVNEPFISNKRGTIAMAKLGGDPNSATSQWFINLADNSGTSPNGLDFQNGGFTVFGHVVAGDMNVVDAIAALPQFNAGSPFDSLPVRNYTSPNPIKVPNLVSIPDFVPTSPLTYTATTSNSNVATVVASEGNLLIKALQIGTSQITVVGHDLDGAGPVTQSFTVNVVAAPGRLRNIATRADFPTGAEELVAGFIIKGHTAKQLIVRATSFSVGVDSPLADPRLELFDSAGNSIAVNDNWMDATNHQLLTDLAIAPTNPKEAALIITVPATGPDYTGYTARVRSNDGTPGHALVEVFDIDSMAGSILGNISTLGHVGTGSDILIGGFILQGSTTAKVIIRALGPSLSNHNVSGALADPMVNVYNGQGTLLATNDNWQTDPNANDIVATGLMPENTKESAVELNLPAGGYTAQVIGVGNTTGVGQIEVYQVP